ncbi:MAG: hypothetical protein ABI336_00250 [Humibacillus sp.]
MTKLTTATLALLLAGSLTACSKDTTASSPEAPAARPSSSAGATAGADPSTSAPSNPSGGTATGVPTGAPTETATGTPGSTPSTTAAPVPVDQSTPEAAMTSWLGAMVAGQGQTVCDVMAIKGQPIKDIDGAAKACGEKITPMLEKITALGGAFAGLQISGATVAGNTATFESVTTTPALAADVVSSFQAVKVGGKWYVSQG